MKNYNCTFQESEHHDICDKDFATPRALAIHKTSHDRKKSKCPRCNRMVMYLETHLVRAHRTDVAKTLVDITEAFEELVLARARIEELEKINRGLRRQVRQYEDQS